jgi:hypothetical protein
VSSLIPAGRAAANRLMYDTVTITREDSAPVLDITTGLYTPSSTTTVYEGPARIRAANVVPTDVGDRLRMKESHQVTIPADSAAVIANRDVLTVTASVSPTLVGRSYTVLGESIGTTVMTRKFNIEAIQGS